MRTYDLLYFVKRWPSALETEPQLIISCIVVLQACHSCLEWYFSEYIMLSFHMICVICSGKKLTSMFVKQIAIALTGEVFNG